MADDALTRLLAQLEGGLGRAAGAAGAERGTAGLSGLADTLALLGRFQTLDRRDLRRPADEVPADGTIGGVAIDRLEALRQRLAATTGRAGTGAAPSGTGGTGSPDTGSPDTDSGSADT